MKLKLFPLIGLSATALLLASLLLLGACTSTKTTTATATMTTTSTAVAATTSISTLTTVSTTTSTMATTSKTTSASTATSTSASQKQYGGVLKIVNQNGPSSTFGWPVEVRDAGGSLAGGLCYETLVLQDVTGSIIPWLATDWQLAPDKKSITFALRKGVKFQDGTDFNAQAAKFSLDAYIDAGQSATKTWENVEVVDDYTVRINLKNYQNTMPGDLSSIRIVSPTAYETKGLDWLRANPVGTGPFKFVNLERDVKTVFEKNDGYWQEGKPYLDGIEYVYIADPMTQSLALQAGEVHALTQPSITVAADLKSQDFNVLVGGTIASRALLPDAGNTDSIFADKRLRQAVEYAIDKDAIAKSLGYGFMTAVYQLADPNTNAYIPDLIRKYNPDKARALLAEAGFSGGFDTWISPNPGVEKEAAVAVQRYLSQVGINTDVRIVEYPKFVEMRMDGWQNGLLIQPMPASTNFASFPAQFYFSTTSFQLGPSLMKPEAFLDLIDKALAADTAEDQKSLNQQLNRMIYDDSMVIPIYALGQGIFVWSLDLHDAGFCEGSSWPAWHPEEAWLSK